MDVSVAVADSVVNAMDHDASDPLAAGVTWLAMYSVHVPSKEAGAEGNPKALVKL